MTLPGFSGDAELGQTAQRHLAKFVERLRLRTAGNPVLSAEVERGLKISGVTVRAMVSHLRVQRQPVASSGKGYFWARSRVELQETIDHLKARVTRMNRVISALEQCFANDNQLSLTSEDVDNYAARWVEGKVIDNEDSRGGGQ